MLHMDVLLIIILMIFTDFPDIAAIGRGRGRGFSGLESSGVKYTVMITEKSRDLLDHVVPEFPSPCIQHCSFLPSQRCCL